MGKGPFLKLKPFQRQARSDLRLVAAEKPAGSWDHVRDGWLECGPPESDSGENSCREPVSAESSTVMLGRQPNDSGPASFRIENDMPAGRRARREVHREKEFIERVISSVAEGIFAFDRDCRCTMWNPAMEHIFGLPEADALGRPAFDVLPFLKTTGEEKVLHGVLRGKSSVTRERLYRMADRQGYFDAFYSPIFEETGSAAGKGAIIGGLAILHDITERKRAQDMLGQLSARLLRSRDDERRRIARELHDSTAQTLYALLLNLDVVERRIPSGDAKLVSALLESRSLAERAAQEIRNLSHLLHPPDLDTIGLLPAMRWYASRFSERTRVRVDFQLPSAIQRLPQDTELALFRAFQESLNNVYRHSGSRTAEVRLAVEQGNLSLEVRDHGRGSPRGAAGRPQVPTSDDETVSTGIGIDGMKARMEQLGGKLTVRFSDKGTVVRATVPLAALQAEGA
ncbi:MAG: histidine kinase [Terriglobia bacterium]